MSVIYFETVEGYITTLPSYATSGSAGMDVYLPYFSDRFFKDLKGVSKRKINVGFDSVVEISIKPKQIVKIPLGLKCAFNDRLVLLAKNRSSLSLNGLTKLAQVVDSDYRGQLFVSFYNCGKKSVKIKSGERIIQFVLTPYEQAEVQYGIPDFMKETERGAGGFGSTGK